jgi:predicted tellurium resistance membrane protein TerC
MTDILQMLLDPSVWASFVTLCALEVVLGFDNLVLITILTDKLPPHRRSAARRLGLLMALVTRVLLLSLIFILAHLADPLFNVLGQDVSFRDIVLIVGGLFLIGKGTMEIHHKIEGASETGHTSPKYAGFSLVVGQIIIMDIVFSFDSVLTAIGVAEHVEVMIAAIIVSVLFMLAAVNFISDFIAKHPTLKVLALSYMLLIGMALVGEGMHQEIPKGYLYFAMAFSFGVEGVNMLIRRKHKAAIEKAKSDN